MIIKIHYLVDMLLIIKIILNRLVKVLLLNRNLEIFLISLLNLNLSVLLIMIMILLKGRLEVIKVIKFQVFHLWSVLDRY
jgi:hypothetical protein